MLYLNFALLQKTFQPPARNLRWIVCALCRKERDSTGSCPYLLSAVKTQALLGGRSFLGGSPTFNGKRAQKTGSGTCTICVESCNKVTPKYNRVTLKERSELTNNQAPFGDLSTLSLTALSNLNIPALPAGQRTPRALSERKGGSHTLRPSSSWAERKRQELSMINDIFSACHRFAGAAETVFVISFCKQHFHDQLKIYKSVLL